MRLTKLNLEAQTNKIFDFLLAVTILNIFFLSIQCLISSRCAFLWLTRYFKYVYLNMSRNEYFSIEALRMKNYLKI